MNKTLRMAAIGVLAVALYASTAAAQSNTNSYILRSPGPAQAQAACQTYGLTLVRTIHAPDVYLVQASNTIDPNILAQMTHGDPNVSKIQVAGKMAVPENPAPPPPSPVASSPAPAPAAPSPATVAAPPVPPPAALNGNQLKLYGSSVWSSYVQQPALASMNASALIQPNLSGSGIIAVIDTGVDPSNVVLAPVLVPGYDFTQGLPGGSELGDVNQSTAHILFQSTAHILFGNQAVPLNPTSSALVDSATASAMLGVQLPNDFGHGTMVAGLIHLVAPSAQIMPLKAFNSDGSADEANVIAAIYYAADNNADVINMSFGFPQISDALMKAINYASRHGVICVASVGNNSQNALVYPAAFGNVIGVASVSSQNQLSSFSNFGPDMVTIAAPGENLITTYPGNHYAAVWGTSFSAALVSGAVDLLMQSAKGNLSSQLLTVDYARALGRSNPCITDGSVGAGCVDLNQASKFIQSMNMQAAPPTTSH